jgi:YD repeat-containing protein
MNGLDRTTGICRQVSRALLIGTLLAAGTAHADFFSPQLLWTGGIVGDAAAAMGNYCAQGAKDRGLQGGTPTNVLPADPAQRNGAVAGFSFDCIATKINCDPANLVLGQSCTNIEFGGSVFGFPSGCPAGYAANLQGFCVHIPTSPEPNLNTGKPCPFCGNPINPANGNKFEQSDDYSGSGPFPLVFSRYYNSDPLALTNGQWSLFGRRWRHTYARNIIPPGCPGAYPGDCTKQAPMVERLIMQREDGKALFYSINRDHVYHDSTANPSSDTFLAGSIVADPFLIGKLETLFSADGRAVTGWRYTSPENDEIELYDSSGKLLSITNRAGLTQTLTYDSKGRLAQVGDPFGRTLTFDYVYPDYPISSISKVTDPAGGIFRYAYNSDGMLASVAYPDGKTRTYVYNETAYIGGVIQPALTTAELTGIVDENGDRYANFGYDDQGRALLTEHAGGVGRYAITFTRDYNLVADPLGTSRVYTFTVNFGQQQISGVSLPPCPSCGPRAAAYDANSFPAMRTNSNGVDTRYVHDARGLQTSRTEAVGNTPARTITTTWDTTYRLPTQIVETGRSTTFIYDAAGNLTQKTISAGSQNRTWSYTYDTRGLRLTADGPRTDVTDVTTFTYDNQGNLSSVTNALGQVTTIGPYDANGRPLSITDPNGLVTQLGYDPRGRLTTRNVGGELTRYDYDGAGQLIRVTMPDASTLQYTYNAAHQFTGIANSAGERIAYTLDAMGNRLREDVYDGSAQLAQTRRRIFDNASRLITDIGASNQTTAYGNDNEGNVTQVTDPLGHRTFNNYDALNRLSQVRDELSGFIRYSYDPLDQLTQVVDQRNLTTRYTVDGLGNVSQVQSPDTGTANSDFDAAGNLLTRTDAKGQVASYTYDALNRVTSISYSGDPSLNVAFTYDQGTNGIGRLTGVTDNTGTMTYSFEAHGRLASEFKTVGGVAYLTSYAYDTAGRLTDITYPSGRQVSYSRDGLGRINGVTTTMNNVTQTLLTGVSYRPFGPEQVLTFGNNQTYTRGFDQDGRIASYTLPGQTLALGYDSASRISFVSDAANPGNTLNLIYDELDRLLRFTATGTLRAFTYDAVGNRLGNTIGSNTYVASYSASSNRITQVTGPTAKTFTLDANGSIVNDVARQFTYDARGRMSQATTASGTSQYLLNAMGQRVRKTSGGVETVFHYDSGGRLISETDALGAVRLEYVYLNDIPLVVFK